MLGALLMSLWMGSAQAGELHEVLARHVDAAGRVNYAAASADPELEDVVAALAEASEPTDDRARKAFWINAYNILTVDLVADHWPLASIRDLDGGNPWDARRFRVAGRSVTLNDIEHRILRPMGDPRIHAAVNCASEGCPPLSSTPFSPEGIEAELDRACAAWARTTAVTLHRAEGTVLLSKIFDWYGEDFAAGAVGHIPGLKGKPDAAVQFLAGYLPETERSWLLAGGYRTRWADYSWKVNQQPL